MNQVIYIMGVAGSGKSTIGRRLSEAIGVPFFDGDDFHPQTNIDKMASGQALNDEDRKAWLESIINFVKKQLPKNSLIIACSALKQIYREQLEKGIENQTQWVYLKGDYNLIFQRMQQRKDHFMPSNLLTSQFETLEEPDHALVVSIDLAPEQIIEQISKQLTK